MKIVIINNKISTCDDSPNNRDATLEEIEILEKGLPYSIEKGFAQIDKVKIEKEKNTNKIAELKQQLSNSDYKAIKYAEGLISDLDYQPTKTERESVRAQIRQLENKTLD